MGKQLKLTEPQIYQLLLNSGYNVELISGKWFLNKKEMQLYGKGGLFSVLSFKIPQLGDLNSLERFLKWFMNAENDIMGDWPELPILTKAKQKIAEGYRPKQLAYPLNEKELKIIHYLLDGDPKDTYAIFFHGVGKSGKSTVCNLIESLFGIEDTSKCSFNSLGDKFARETLAGKRLWYDADINANWSDTSNNVFKKIITHDSDQFEKKGKNPYFAQYRCKPLFCCNIAPRFDITDSGILRRILYYSKNTVIQNPDGSLANRRWTEEELLDVAIAALLTDMTNWVDDFIDETHEIIMSSNSVGKYGMDCNYDTYEIRCQANRVMPFGYEKYTILKEMFNKWVAAKS